MIATILALGVAVGAAVNTLAASEPAHTPHTVVDTGDPAPAPTPTPSDDDHDEDDDYEDDDDHEDDDDD